MERLESAGRRRRLARTTREAYAYWVEAFLRFWREASGVWVAPEALRGPEVEAFLTHLVRERRLSASSQNQALCGIVFLYRHVVFDEAHDPDPDHPAWRRHLGHASLKTTMIYTHVMQKPAVSVVSPLDRLGARPLDRLAAV